MIRISDLSERAKKIYRECKKGDRAGSDFVEYLLDNDFEKSEIKQFVRKHFKFNANLYEEWYELR